MDHFIVWIELDGLCEILNALREVRKFEEGQRTVVVPVVHLGGDLDGLSVVIDGLHRGGGGTVDWRIVLALHTLQGTFPCRYFRGLLPGWAPSVWRQMGPMGTLPADAS